MTSDELRRVAKRVPLLLGIVRSVRGIVGSLQPRRTVFRKLYEENGWGGRESVSGPGSDYEQTQILRSELPALWNRYGIKRLLDAPCGDFRWMQSLVSSLDEYVGMDIVEPLILRNAEIHGTDAVQFIRGDLVNDTLPSADMLLCRDCLVHLSTKDVLKAIANIKRSNIKYLLVTVFPTVERNADIYAGQWRPLNLTRPPFNLPAPIELLNEGYAEVDGAWSDKSLALWRLSDI